MLTSLGHDQSLYDFYNDYFEFSYKPLEESCLTVVNSKEQPCFVAYPKQHKPGVSAVAYNGKTVARTYGGADDGALKSVLGPRAMQGVSTKRCSWISSRSTSYYDKFRDIAQDQVDTYQLTRVEW